MTTAALRLPRVAGTTSIRVGLAGLGRAVLGTADGLVAGLVLAFVVLTAVGAPASYLGIPAPLAVVVIGGITAAFAATLAGVALLARRLITALVIRIVDRPAVAARPRLAWLLSRPRWILAGLPVGWLAAFGGLLWLALVGPVAIPPL